MSFLLWFLIILSLGFLLWRQSRKNLYKNAAKIPGPEGWPIFGILPDLFGNKEDEVFTAAFELMKPYGDFIKGWFGPILLVVVERPEYLKIVLNSEKCLSKAFVYDFLGVNKGLMAAKPNVWRFHRKYLNNCFNPKLLQSFIPIFNRASVRMNQYMSKKLGQGEFDLYHFVGKCTLDMICSTSMGLNHDFQGPTGDIYLESTHELADVVNKRLFNLFYHSQQIYNLTKNYLIESKAWAGMRTVSSRVMENAQKVYVKPVPKELNIKSELRKPCIFVEQVYKLFQYTKEFDEQMLKDEIDTLIAGGNETSGMTMAFCFLMLAMHQDIQERVMEELRSVFNTADEDVTAEHLSQLPYSTMVINETLRLFPITPFVGRDVDEDLQLDKYTIPKGCNLVIPIFKLHRQEAIWGPEANLFNPDNFLPEKVASRHPYAWIPFSAGLRNCIGYKYAQISMKIMLCQVLRCYKFNTSLKYSEMKFKMALDLKIASKHMVSIEKRIFK